MMSNSVSDLDCTPELYTNEINYFNELNGTLNLANKLGRVERLRKYLYYHHIRRHHENDTYDILFMYGVT